MKRQRTSGSIPRFASGSPPQTVMSIDPDQAHQQQVQARSDRRLGWLMMPLRIFFGLTFLYAGLDKLLDPSFLDPNAAGSIVAQMQGFLLHSPLAPLISSVGLRAPIVIGFLMALGEIAIGLGALTGLAFRLAAFGGFAVSMLFFLTASWSTSPYFYGPDLPYAFGWLTLALVGDRGVLTLAPRLERARAAITAPVPAPDPWHPGKRSTGYATPPEPTTMPRRLILQASVLAGVAVIFAAVAHFVMPSGASASGGTGGDTVGGLGGGGTADGGGTLSGAVPTDTPYATDTPFPTDTPVVDATPGPTPAPGATPTPRPTPRPTKPPSGTVIGNVSDLRHNAATFQNPRNGDPAVVIKLKDGTFSAFDTVCTHAGCTVQYVPRYDALLCPCHGAAFDPEHHAAVLQGPTSQPLRELPITVDQATGQIYLHG